MNLTGPVLVALVDGALIAIFGSVFTTVTFVFEETEPADPAGLVAVPEAREIERVPSPVMFEIVIVRPINPSPETDTVPFAVPDLFRETLALVKLIAAAFV